MAQDISGHFELLLAIFWSLNVMTNFQKITTHSSNIYLSALETSKHESLFLHPFQIRFLILDKCVIARCTAHFQYTICHQLILDRPKLHFEKKRKKKL